MIIRVSLFDVMHAKSSAFTFNGQHGRSHVALPSTMLVQALGRVAEKENVSNAVARSGYSNTDVIGPS